MEKNARRRWWRLAAITVVLIIAYGTLTAVRPLPALLPTSASSSLVLHSNPSVIVWPSVGQAAVGIVGSNILNTHGPQKPAPTASTAKMITALMVLKQKPLNLGQQGPMITLSAADQAIYNSYNAHGGSVVSVQAGEQISEYQMLEAMLLPSANNMADSLAIWAYGSLPAYSTAANSYLKQLGLRSTTVGSDASGYDPSTVSSAHDLVLIGETIMQNPVLAGIVSQSIASGLPLVGTVKNVNSLLGSSGIVGIKTGNTDQAGGVYITAARTTVNQKSLTIVTALLGAPTLFDAMKFSLPLVQTAEANFKTANLIKAGEVVGTYHSPWGNNLTAVTVSSLTLQTWSGTPLTAHVQLLPIRPTLASKQKVGSLTTPATPSSDQKTVGIELINQPTKPTIWWRLRHPGV